MDATDESCSITVGPVHDEQSASPSPLATRLCGDMLVAIAEWLSSASLGALTLCGNRRLNDMFARHMPSLTHQVETRNFAWPFYIRRWKHLKHLDVQYPGHAHNLSEMDTNALLRLAARVLRSLPASLESLQLDNIPLNFRDALRIMWKRHCNAVASPTTAPAVEVFHTSGNLDVLCKLRLPKLCSFSFSKRNISMQGESLFNWLGQIKTLSLTSLSLQHLTLVAIDPSLSSVFYALPRTLTNLELDILNYNHDARFINPFDAQRQSDWLSLQMRMMPSIDYDSAPAIVDHCANALPPHLTRLKLTLQKASHLPAVALSRLSNLVTLKLKVIRHHHTTFSDRDTDARVLTHLPPSVTKLSLNGFSATDLTLYLLSIPEEHVNLRHLAIKRIVFSGLSPESYGFFYIITSGLPFRQLESLHIFSDNKEPFRHDMSHPTDDVEQLDEYPYAGIRHMTHLRSVSRFFLWPCFIAHIMRNPAFLNANAPMRICDKKGFTAVMDLSDPQWYRHFRSESSPPRLAIDSLFLMIDNPQHDRPLITSTDSQALRTTFEGVKHLVLSNFIGIEILKDWPGCLKSLDILPPAIIPSDMAFDSCWASVRYLRALKISNIFCTFKGRCTPSSISSSRRRVEGRETSERVRGVALSEGRVKISERLLGKSIRASFTPSSLIEFAHDSPQFFTHMQDTHMSMFAARLSNDAFTHIAELLDSGSLGALVLCGNRRLQYKLAHQVHTVYHHSKTRRFTWPFYIRGWIGLKHLHVNAGHAFEFRHADYQERAIALAERVLQSLPPSLESLHLDDSVLPFRDVFRATWQSRQLNPSLNRLSGNLAVLCRVHLPNLRTLSFATNPKTQSSRVDERLVEWINYAEHVPLTRLSLSHVTLSNMDPCLCSVLYSLPRTLIDLELHINNQDRSATQFRDEFVIYTRNHPSMMVDNDFFANALPPHLTRLKLDFAVASHMPAALLSSLSNLTTLSLCMRLRSPFTPNSRDVLSCLPASVTQLSLRGLLTTDLQSYVASVPEDHNALRRLTIKNVVFPPGSHGMCDFIHTIASRAPFRQLEALHVFIDRDAIGLLIPGYFISNSANIDETTCDGLKSMTRLRSVSDFFTWPCFASYWDYLAAASNVDNTPMTIRHREDRIGYVDARTLRILLSNPTSQRLIATDRFMMTSAVSKLLANSETTAVTTAATSSNADDYADAENDQQSSIDVAMLKRVLETVKHLRFASNSNGLEVLHQWPSTGCLSSLEVINYPSTQLIEVAFQTLPTCMRALRVLNIDYAVKVTCLSNWLQCMPNTLETLTIYDLNVADELNKDQTVSASPSKHILSYIPPRLKIMDVSGGFAIGKETFDAVVMSSLHTVKWLNVMGVYCSASDMCRWPRDMRYVHVSTSPVAVIPPNYEQYAVDLKKWYESAPCLTTGWFIYYENRCRRELFGRRLE